MTKKGLYLAGILLTILIGTLLYWMFCCECKVNEKTVVIENGMQDSVTVNAIPDTDGDGVNDEMDKCPKTPGIADNQGCPEMVLLYKKAEAALSEDDKVQLDKVFTFLNNHPTVNISIEGHTSTLGETDFNQKLSETRAANSVEYLISKGIDAGRLSAVGYGEQYPVGDNATEEGRAQSRRTVIKIK
jgi:OmpA-OmpF porin, OOP family